MNVRRGPNGYRTSQEMDGGCIPSLVMNDMNSLTHSCMHSLASLAILALSGRAVFIIRATGAKLRMLASDSGRVCLEPRGGEMDCGDLRDIALSLATEIGP